MEIEDGASTKGADPVSAALVYDFLQQGAGCGRPPPEPVRRALRCLADEFSAQFRDQFAEMCGRLEVSEQTVSSTVEGVADELFNDGIKWARIVALFVFGGELATHCRKRDRHRTVDAIAASLANYVSEKLLPWIRDHGGWEGLIVFHEGSESEQNSRHNRWPSVRNLLCLGISAIGALTIGAVLTKS